MIGQTKLADHEKTVKAFDANLSMRYRRLDSLERWGDGTQYDHLQGWWDDTEDKPLWERAPCIVYPVVSIAARSNVDLCLGEGRFPEFSSKPSEDEADEENGLGEEASKVFDRFIREYHRISRFRAFSRDEFYSAQCCGSSAGIHGVRNGKPFNELVPAKWCTPTFGADGQVATLEIRYPFVEEYKQPNGSQWATRAKLYRRVIDNQRDVEYFHADALEDGAEPIWKENPDRSVDHAFGFCPVVWYPLMKGATTVNEIDGRPIHARITDEIHAHDIARSQWHRGALLSEPQVFETGVTKGYNPTELGRQALVPTTEKGGSPDAVNNPITGAFVPGRGTGSKARKKGPGFVWQYENPDAKVDVLNYPDGALKAQQDNCSDLRIKIQESLAVVFLDPENIKFAATTSGKALEAIKQKQLDRCDQFRDDLAETFFEPSVSMQLRIAHALLDRGQGLKVPGAKSVKPVLDQLMVSGEWQMPTLSITYGPYFKPDPADQQKIVDLVQSALGGGEKEAVITLSIAVSKIASIFGIENAEVIVSELVKAKKEKQALITNAAPKPEEPKKPVEDLAA